MRGDDAPERRCLLRLGPSPRGLGGNSGREFLIIFSSGYGFGLEGRISRSRFVPLAAGGRWAARRAVCAGRAARRPPHPPWPTAAHRRTKRISSSLIKRSDKSPRSQARSFKLQRNFQLAERNYLRWNSARALPRCRAGAGGSHSTPSSPAPAAPFHRSLCTGSCLGKGPWRPRVPLLSLSPPASFCAGSRARRTELAGRSSAAWKAAALRQGARKRKHGREGCSGHPAGLPVSTSGFKTGP